MSTATPNLASAIIKAMKTLKGIEKTMTVGTGNFSYKGVSDKDVKHIVGKAMEDNGLCILPIDVDAKTTINRWEDNYQKQKQQIFTEITTSYLLLHESGESQVIKGYGHGVDSQDKAAGKATTYALKYALLYVFMIPTGTIDDADNTHSNEHETPQKTVKPHIKEGGTAWQKAIKHLSSGGLMEDITEHMVITEKQQETLIELAEKQSKAA